MDTKVTADIAKLRVDGKRLWASLMELAQIGATAKGGVCRLTLTDLDKQGRDLVSRWAKEAGMTITIDKIGNGFLRRPGRNNSLPPVMTGSHIDTQPTGGKFDGNYGVLAGLEVVRTLNDHGIETEAPIEVAWWTNEEGSRFVPVMMGSGVFAKAFTLEHAYAAKDTEGKTVKDELQRIGYIGTEEPGEHPIGCYFETHIEQGPVLEDNAKTIGVVTGVLGIRWYDCVVTGMEAHAGPTPMALRKDALQVATKLIPAATPGGLATVELQSGATLKAKTIVLSPGARWRQMNVPGEAEYRNKGVAYCPHCDGPLFKGKRVAVIGGGNSGAEAAIDLAGLVSHVTLIEFDGQLRADAVLQAKLRSLPNATVIVSAQTTEVQGDGARVTGLVYKDRSSGAQHTIELEGIFVQIGLVPNTEWLKGSIALSSRGEIEVDARGATSAPGIFAAGDATTVPYKQIVIAMGEGAKAGLGAFDHLIRSPVPTAKPAVAVMA